MFANVLGLPHQHGLSANPFLHIWIVTPLRMTAWGFPHGKDLCSLSG